MIRAQPEVVHSHKTDMRTHCHKPTVKDAFGINLIVTTMKSNISMKLIGEYSLVCFLVASFCFVHYCVRDIVLLL